MPSSIAHLAWNPPRIAFTIPFIERPVAWYGICFVFGLIVGYFLIVQLFYESLRKTIEKTQAKARAYKLADRLSWFVIGGVFIGARLGHVLFYEWPYYKEHLWEIFYVWQGGLASHGFAMGFLFALYLYRCTVKKECPSWSYLTLLDWIVIPTAFVAFCIRVGNFVNQEVVGTESGLPWAILFGSPAIGGPVVPRHPTQLYEALFYLLSFFILLTLWKKKKESLHSGALAGLFFLLIFGARFCIEYVKAPLSQVINESFLSMGQYLSIPFLLFGVSLLLYPLFTRRDVTPTSTSRFTSKGS